MDQRLDKDNMIDSLQDKIDEVNTEIGNLEEYIQTLNKERDELTGKIEEFTNPLNERLAEIEELRFESDNNIVFYSSVRDNLEITRDSLITPDVDSDENVDVEEGDFDE